VPLNVNNLNRIYEGISSPSNAIRPNKASLAYARQTFDLLNKIKQDAETANNSSLDNLKESTSFYVVKTSLMKSSDVMYGIKTHPDADPDADKEKKPSETKWEWEHAGVLVHHGWVMNGSGVVTDRDASHIQFAIAYEFFKDIDLGENRKNMDMSDRAGHTGKVRFHTDDTTVMVIESWQGAPESKQTAAKLSDWYGIKRDSLKTPGEGKPRPQKGKGKGGSGKRQPPPPPPAPGGELGGATPIVDIKCDDRSTWKPINPESWKTWRFSKKSPGYGVRSKFDVKSLPSEVQALWEAHPSGEWGPSWKHNKPPGMPQACRQTLSQRSSIQIMDYYLNKIPESVIPKEYFWWVKAMYTSFFRSESGIMLGNPAGVTDMRGAPDGDYCSHSIEKGTVSTKRRIHSICDGPRHPGRAFISAIGLHGANFDAWNGWLAKTGRPYGHVALQSIEDEVRVPFEFYWLKIVKPWVDAQKKAGRPTEMNQDIAEKLVAASTLQHGGGGFGRACFRKTKNLLDIDGLWCRRTKFSGGEAKYYDPIPGPVVAAVQKMFRSITLAEHMQKYGKLFGSGSFLSIYEVRVYTTWERIHSFQKTMQHSIPGGYIHVPLDSYRNRNPRSSAPHLEKMVNGKRYGVMRPRK